ncbi:MAG: pyridoxamine 5'-phosphate oxidase family protein [Alphaproteobacteria bacterium]|nr:pyridoxamine 5'-phosphate oxidase family protein [Alphaproteobacteria bacterium]
MPDDIRTVEELVDHYGKPKGHLAEKEKPKLSDHCRRFLELSPFCVLSTSAAGDGPADCSPRGDAPGFVHVIDDTTIAIPDRPGNRRTDTFHNIVENPEIAAMFMVPGLNEVMRLNGRARLTTEPALLEKMVANGKTPLAALVIDIRYVYFHCGKAIIRADLWNPDNHLQKGDFPTLGQINQDWYGVDKDEIDARLADDYANNLY